MQTRTVARLGRDAFDPLRIEKWERRIFAQCHPKQLGFVSDPANRISCLVGRGGGKTTGGLLRFLLKMLRRPRMRCVFLAATRESAEELIWDQLKDSLDNLDVPYVPHQVKLKCTLENGSTLILRGCDSKDDINKLRGRHFDEVGIDETAIVPPALLDDIIDRVIGPRLVGALWMISTPGHVLGGEFYNATRYGAVDGDGVPLHRPYDERNLPAYAGWDRWSSHAWTLLDGIAAGVPAMVIGWANALKTKERKGWSDDNPIWQREYLGRWAADNTENVYRYQPHDKDGRPWNQWDPERVGPMQIAKLPDTFTDWSYVIGMDMGHSDPFALVVLAFSPSDTSRTIYEVYEFQQTKMYAKPIAQLLLGEDLSTEHPGGIIGLIGWPDAIVADMAHLGGSVLDELQHVYGIKSTMAEKGIKYKLPAIELANGDLVDGRIKILKGGHLEEEMRSLSWVTDEFNRVKENAAQANHNSDAFIYARNIISKLFISSGAVEPVVQPKPTRAAPPPPELPVYRDVSDEGSMLTPGTFDAGEW